MDTSSPNNLGNLLGTVIVSVLLIASEVMPFISSMKSNGILHAILIFFFNEKPGETDQEVLERLLEGNNTERSEHVSSNLMNGQVFTSEHSNLNDQIINIDNHITGHGNILVKQEQPDSEAPTRSSKFKKDNGISEVRYNGLQNNSN